MATAKTLFTAADLFALPDDGFQYELIDGELIRMPAPGFRHSRITARVARYLDAYVDVHGLGTVVDHGGFTLQAEPEVVLAPDVAFVSADRLPPDAEIIGCPEIPPDLAVEVISPSETEADVETMVGKYFRSGVRLVWLLDPESKTINVRLPDSSVTTFTMDHALNGGKVLPGFSIPVAALFR